MTQTEGLLAIVNVTLITSIRFNTHKGYIGWSSCDNICMAIKNSSKRKIHLKHIRCLKIRHISLEEEERNVLG